MDFVRPDVVEAFLMHRVELKDAFYVVIVRVINAFLMHRVELKAKNFQDAVKHAQKVPNAPCGVERMGESAVFDWESSS